MASADFSPPVRNRSRPPAPANRRGGEISQGKTLILPSSAAGFTCVVSVWLLGFPVRRRVTPPHRPCIRFLFVSSEVCLKASSPPHLAVTQLPSANGSGHTARRGLSPPRSVPCPAHVDGCRTLARQFRKRVGARQARAVALVGGGDACPFDLHMLLPVRAAILQLGPTHPEARSWLTTQWGITDRLRQVLARPQPGIGRRLAKIIPRSATRPDA
jgi:hypothetical protein